MYISGAHFLLNGVKNNLYKKGKAINVVFFSLYI